MNSVIIIIDLKFIEGKKHNLFINRTNSRNENNKNYLQKRKIYIQSNIQARLENKKGKKMIIERDGAQ